MLCLAMIFLPSPNWPLWMASQHMDKGGENVFKLLVFNNMIVYGVVCHWPVDIRGILSYIWYCRIRSENEDIDLIP